MKPIFCKDTNETCFTYKEYLESKHWLRIKISYAKTNTKKCRMCESKTKINLHHMTYENLGHESFSDILYLCENCHKIVHKELNDCDLKEIFLNNGRIVSKKKFTRKKKRQHEKFDKWAKRNSGPVVTYQLNPEELKAICK